MSNRHLNNKIKRRLKKYKLSNIRFLKNIVVFREACYNEFGTSSKDVAATNKFSGFYAWRLVNETSQR